MIADIQTEIRTHLESMGATETAHKALITNGAMIAIRLMLGLPNKTTDQSLFLLNMMQDLRVIMREWQGEVIEKCGVEGIPGSGERDDIATAKLLKLIKET